MDLRQVSVTSSSLSQRAWSFHFLYFQCPRVKSADDDDDDNANPQHGEELSDAWGAAEVSVGNWSAESSAAFPCTCCNVNMERCKSLSVPWCFIHMHIHPFSHPNFFLRSLFLPISLTQPLASWTIHNREKKKEIRRKNHTLWQNKNVWGCCGAGNATFESQLCYLGESSCLYFSVASHQRLILQICADQREACHYSVQREIQHI